VHCDLCLSQQSGRTHDANGWRTDAPVYLTRPPTRPFLGALFDGYASRSDLVAATVPDSAAVRRLVEEEQRRLGLRP
jgi:hypothetical protein